MWLPVFSSTQQVVYWESIQVFPSQGSMWTSRMCTFSQWWWWLLQAPAKNGCTLSFFSLLEIFLFTLNWPSAHHSVTVPLASFFPQMSSLLHVGVQTVSLSRSCLIESRWAMITSAPCRPQLLLVPKRTRAFTAAVTLLCCCRCCDFSACGFAERACQPWRQKGDVLLWHVHSHVRTWEVGIKGTSGPRRENAFEPDSTMRIIINEFILSKSLNAASLKPTDVFGIYHYDQDTV